MSKADRRLTFDPFICPGCSRPEIFFAAEQRKNA